MIICAHFRLISINTTHEYIVRSNFETKIIQDKNIFKIFLDWFSLFHIIFASKLMDRTVYVLSFWWTLIIISLIVSCRHCIYFYASFLISCLIFIYAPIFTNHRKCEVYRIWRLSFRIQDKTILYWYTGIGCVWSWFREIIIFWINVDDISWTSVTREKCCSVRNKNT